MTYEVTEKSVNNGEPYELYEFTRGIHRWRYTSAQEDIIIDSATYTAITIERGNLEDSGELGRSSLNITVPRVIDFIQEYIIYPPSEVTLLTIYRNHHSLATPKVVIWMGRLLNLKWRESVVDLNCEPVYTSVKRTGLRRKYTRQCPHVLYSKKCGLNNTNWKVDGSVIGIDSHKISVAIAGANGDNYYSGGYAEWDYNGRKEKRMIMRQIGSLLTLSGIPIGLTGSQTVSLYPGCDHLLATCNTKFNNKLNFGGFPWIPIKNPFANLALW